MLTEEEKQNLKSRIACSVAKQNRRTKIKQAVFSLSSLLVVLLGIFYLIPENSYRNMASFHQQLSAIQSDSIHLHLNTGEKLRFTSANPVICHDKDLHAFVVDGKPIFYSPKGTAYFSLVVPYGKKSSLILQDGSKIWLNSGTKLTAPIAFSNKNRVVALGGEAIFDIKHHKDKQFVVHTEQYDVQVFGTVFQISNYPNDSLNKVGLKQGSISICPTKKLITQKKKIDLKPGNLMTIDRQSHKINIQNVELTKLLSWSDDTLILEKEKLSQILKKLSRHYAIPIVLKSNSLKEQYFSGRLDVGKNLESVLKSMQILFQFKIQKQKNGNFWIL